jgi:hypothetical protein
MIEVADEHHEDSNVMDLVEGLTPSFGNKAERAGDNPNGSHLRRARKSS